MALEPYVSDGKVFWIDPDAPALPAEQPRNPPTPSLASLLLNLYGDVATLGNGNAVSAAVANLMGKAGTAAKGLAAKGILPDWKYDRVPDKGYDWYKNDMARNERDLYNFYKSPDR